MKTILTMVFVTTMLSLKATHDPIGPILIFESSNIEFTVSNSADAKLLSIAQFNETDSNLEFQTQDEITFVQVYTNEGALQFQLPVMSNKLKIGKSLFEEGSYKIGFILKGQQEIQFADLKIKK